jgi:hypothetical protein
VTVRDLIKGSLRLLGVLASGEEPTAEEATDALSALNSMIESWKNDSLLVYTVAERNFNLVANQKRYTIGPGGNWDMPRPARVEALNLIYTNTQPQPLVMPIRLLTLEQYNEIIVPDTTSDPAAVMDCYIDGNYPLRNASFYLVPNASMAVTMYFWQSVDTFDGDIATALNLVLALPPGYERALRFNLAVEMANEFGKEPMPSTSRNAVESKAVLKRINYRPRYLGTDPALSPVGGFNYITGTSQSRS